MYKGNKWYKCDFHLHTTSSKCFLDQSSSAQEWIDEVERKGINCVAVTDHNTGDGIDEIVKLAKDKGIIVFPGVELTCDTSKIHLLVLFDLTRTSKNINAFLSLCEIDEDKLGETTAHTSKNVFDILEIAKKKGGIVIPAHIDDYNGLEGMSDTNLRSFLESEDILGVQIVHKQFMKSDINLSDEELGTYFKEVYPCEITREFISKKYSPVKKALEYKKAILTFSDNPSKSLSSKHGIDGIGNSFTWIKMSETPNLNDLRQALLMHDTRIKNNFETLESPYQIPNNWIKSIRIKNTKLSKNFVLNFNPQLNSIIGGRGSGKSSILRFLRGALNNTKDIKGLSEILKDHEDFYKKVNIKQDKGVLEKDSEITIEYIKNNVEYLITINDINNSNDQKIVVNKRNKNTKNLEIVTDFEGMFEVEHYSQKQIYEIAKEPLALKKQLEKFSDKFFDLFREKELVKKVFLTKRSEVRTKNAKMEIIPKLEFKLTECVDQIDNYQKSGISQELNLREGYIKQNDTLKNVSRELEDKRCMLQKGLDNLDILINFEENFNGIELNEVNKEKEKIFKGINKIKDNLRNDVSKLKDLSTEFESFIKDSQWKSNFSKNEEKLKILTEEQGLENKNIVKEFEEKIKEQKEIINELTDLKKENTELDKLNKELDDLKESYLLKSKEVSQERLEVVREINSEGKIKIKINKFRDKQNFEKEFRDIIQKETEYETDINFLVKKCFEGNIEINIKKFIKNIERLHNGEPIRSISGYFMNAMKKLTEEQLDKIHILFPDDEIEVSYKSEGRETYKPLSTASAGQKTAAVLSILLSRGDVPIILDQPEDDLDNKLVYELVVKRLKKIKEKRQIVCVTHNANIPVNGDSEYVISMDSESLGLKILTEGSIDNIDVRKEVCDVMEGTKHAFLMRSKRYEQIGKK